MMTKNWFTCKVRYVKLDESGKEGKVTDQFLLDAYTYTEAEARMTQIIQEMGVGAYEITHITKSNFAEVLRSDEGDLWFKIKIAFISFDDETGKEKQANQYFLISAHDVKDAYERVEKFMKGTISNFVIPSISYTKIIEVYPIAEENSERNKLIAKGYHSVGSSVGEEGVPFNVDDETGEILE
ncbi:MAG: DUF4494 domain-containing protein [Bacteroidetes bacterium]|nr:DUF4494 domain-containing protein [Bacteroidota bacterium]MDG1160368.1 DUF4494 domain-containing protein [Flavobacteriales bacterium]MDG1765918.1 DUF4494 domain-containing protein [Flavobacteriales bacterium]